MFFGIAFGPIVGFIAGFLGNIIADLISGYGFWFWWDLGNRLDGPGRRPDGFFLRQLQGALHFA